MPCHGREVHGGRGVPPSRPAPKPNREKGGTGGSEYSEPRDEGKPVAEIRFGELDLGDWLQVCMWRGELNTQKMRNE